MEVILKEDIKNLGLIGDIVSVKPGYGRNFLVPQGKAVFVTADNLKQLELQKEELRKKELAYYTEKSKNIKVDKDVQEINNRRFNLYDKKSNGKSNMVAPTATIERLS